MLELNGRQRAVLADKLPDAANVGVGAMFFGQFLSERAFSPLVALFGLVIWMSFLGFTIWLEGESES